MNKIKIIAGCAVVLALSGGCASQPRSQASDAEPVIVEGVAVYNPADLAAVSNAALLDAQRAAVESAAGLFQESSAQPETILALKQALLKEPQLYIKKYKTLSARREGELYRMEIRAFVYVNKIAAIMKSSSGESSKAGVGALMFNEYLSGALSADHEARTAFSAKVAGVFNFSASPVLSDSGEEEAFFAAAASSGADLYFVASALAEPLGSGAAQSGFFPAKAKAELKVYESANAKPVLEISVSASAIDSSQSGALKKALTSSGELLGQELLLKKDRLYKKSAAFSLRVSGLTSIDEARTLKAAVDRLPVSSSYIKSYGDGEAIIMAEPVRRDLQELASALLRSGVFNLQLDTLDQSEASFTVLR